ncbi:MAG: HAMP domain-containing sensor histidine kinase [Bacteroidia bacterium]|jgi:two-component system phosphate regulon sensor histidine kinase PhoR
MKTRQIRIFIVLAVLSIAGIIVVQVAWFKRAFDKNEVEFNRNVHIALHEVMRGILKYNNNSAIPPDAIEQNDHNAFTVMINDEINPEVLEYYLVTEFKKFNIKQQFEFGIYDCANQKMVMGRYVEGSGSYKLTESPAEKKGTSDNYYFTVYFPHKSADLIGQMGLWLFSSAVLLVVILIFGYSLFVILRQKKLSEIQRDFINNMTHEFRTPLTTISVSAQTLQDPEIIHSKQRLLNYATLISSEAAKLQHQVNRVLAIAEADHTMHLGKEEVDLHALIRQTLPVQCEAAAKPVSFQMQLDATSAIVYGDKLHLTNALTNLIDNAIKYSKESAALKIKTHNTGAQIQLSIQDNGIGIPKEHAKRIFEKFYRVSQGNAHNAKGFGIGLFYVQLIARLHKGSIQLVPATGNGSEFILTLPLI